MATLRERLAGFKTFIAAGAVGLAGTLFEVLSSMGTIDPTPIVSYFVQDPKALPAAVMLLTLSFTAIMSILRMVTRSAPGGRTSSDQAAPLKFAVDAGE